MVAGGRSASFGLLKENPEAVRITRNVAATDAMLYTNRGDCRLLSQRLKFRQLGAPSVAVKIASSSCAGASTGSSAYSPPRACATPATSGAHFSQVFTWWLKADCSTG